MAELTDTPRPEANAIQLPAWDDILHIKPRGKATPRDYYATRAALEDAGVWNSTRDEMAAELARLQAAGELPEGVSYDAALDIAKRRDQQTQITRSEVPEWRQKMVKVITELDNIEDDVSTVNWLLSPITRRWKPTRAISEIVARTTTITSEVESVLAGPALYKAVQKSKTRSAARRSARKAKGKLSVIQRAAGWVGDNFGHLLEAGQSLDNHAGVGIQLGGIFGAMEEAQDRLVISAWEGAKYLVANAASAFLPADSDTAEGLRIAADQSANEIDRVAGGMAEQGLAMARKYLLEQTVLGRAISNAVSAANIQHANDLYSPGDHALALHRTIITLPLLADTLQHITDPRVIDIIPHLDAPQPRVRNDVTRLMLEAEGATFDRLGYPTGQWQPAHRELLPHLEQGIADALEAMSTWLPAEPTDNQAQLLHELTEQAARAGAQVLTGREDGLHVTHDPETRALMLLHHLEQYPPPGTTLEQMHDWLADQVAAIERDPDTYDGRTWLTITARHWPVATR